MRIICAIDNLERRSRAYNALYGSRDATPDTVQTLSDEEVDAVLEIANEAAEGKILTPMHARMAAMSPLLLHYVVDGGARLLTQFNPWRKCR